MSIRICDNCKKEIQNKIMAIVNPLNPNILYHPECENTWKKRFTKSLHEAIEAEACPGCGENEVHANCECVRTAEFGDE